MEFEAFDRKMRACEKALDSYIDPKLFLCARLDGRGFSNLTERNFKKPYDERFYRYMTETVRHLMNCGFNIIAGYTQSDEISLLFHPADNTYNHKTRKLISVLAGEASGFFSLKLGAPAAFDCRLIPLENQKAVKDYFSWRQTDLLRNSLDSCCYYALLSDGMDYLSATKKLEGRDVPFKTELLSSYGIDYNALPSWQKYGAVLHYERTEKTAINQKTGEHVTFCRRELTLTEELPAGEKFGEYILSLMEAALSQA
ncbi:MAG: tRNA(His) guanylyltransferase Thg1 family protein [Huintestinicola sp.]|uniref:tRNA(His) guanylyltransferase Thg1 family protein n=1 Tax=Huintestinicola sp. TaxID=2981661 RepID=UPI003F07F74F